VYRMLEKIMSIKTRSVLGYLTFLALFMVSPRVGWEVFTGFFRFGDYPQRADTIVVAPHYAITIHEGSAHVRHQGTKEPAGSIIGEISRQRRAADGDLSPEAKSTRDRLVEAAENTLRPGEFFSKRIPNRAPS